MLGVFQRLKYEELSCKNTWQPLFGNSLFSACVKLKDTRIQTLHYLLGRGTKQPRYQTAMTPF